MDAERERESAEIFAEAAGLLEYELQCGVSRQVALRHKAIREIIHAEGGVVPSLGDLRVSLMMRGFKSCSLQTIRGDLQAMGWR